MPRAPYYMNTHKKITIEGIEYHGYTIQKTSNRGLHVTYNIGNEIVVGLSANQDLIIDCNCDLISEHSSEFEIIKVIK